MRCKVNPPPFSNQMYNECNGRIHTNILQKHRISRLNINMILGIDISMNIIWHLFNYISLQEINLFDINLNNYTICVTNKRLTVFVLLVYRTKCLIRRGKLFLHCKTTSNWLQFTLLHF